jgi:hypothetical protein
LTHKFCCKACTIVSVQNENRSGFTNENKSRAVLCYKTSFLKL